MSTVWVAVDQRLDAQVAIKLLDPLIAENPKMLGRFLREARIIAQLRSRHVIRVFDCGVDKGTPFIAMELLKGQSLRQLLQIDRIVSPTRTLAILSDVARAMQAAHEQGIVHRDLKPDNVFLACEDNDVVVKVLDFGIAKRPLQQSSSSSVAFTEAGEVFGTPNYMSPEQIDARSVVDHRADIWAMAIIAFECLTGRVPFIEDTLQEQFLAICMRPIPWPSSIATVPAGFDAWFAKGTARDANERFADAMQACSELQRVCSEVARPSPYEVLPLRAHSDATLVSGNMAASTLRGVTSSAAECTKTIGTALASPGNTSTAVPVTSSKALGVAPKQRPVSSGFLIPAGLLVLFSTGIVAYFALKPARQTQEPNATALSAAAASLAHSPNGVANIPAAASDRVIADVATQNIGSPEPAASNPISIIPLPSASSHKLKPMAPVNARAQAATSGHGSNQRDQPSARASAATRRPRVDLGL